jgi:hypothetical protein
VPELNDKRKALGGQIDAWERSVAIGHEIETWARNIAPAVREVVEIDPAVGVELNRRLCARYAEEHLGAHGLAPPLLQRICAAILGHVLEADHAQPQSVEVARARVRVPDQRDHAFDETLRQIRQFWASARDEWVAPAAASVQAVANIDAALADEAKRRLVADRAATYPYPSDGDDRVANALMFCLTEAIARLS